MAVPELEEDVRIPKDVPHEDESRVSRDPSNSVFEEEIAVFAFKDRKHRLIILVDPTEGIGPTSKTVIEFRKGFHRGWHRCIDEGMAGDLESPLPMLDQNPPSGRLLKSPDVVTFSNPAAK